MPSRSRSEGMTMTVAVKSPADAHHKHVVDEVMRRARVAFESFRDVSQERADEAVRALAWSVYKPEHARELAALAVADTGLGNVPDKIVKNQRKTFGTLRDLLRAKSVGIVEEDKARGIIKYAKPMGVIAALTPSTNPAATPVNKAMMAIKGRNAIVIAPSPLGYETTKRTVELMRAALERTGLPADLVQILSPPVTKELTEALMKAADLVVVTGSQDNVRRAAMSGTPAIGVGAGNVPVIIDDTADLADAARKIRASKIFDNSTSCSSENSVIILDSIYDKAMAALIEVGGYLCTAQEKAAVQQALWHHGKLNRHLIARDPDILAPAFGLPAAAERADFFMVEDSGAGKEHPFSGEKLSLVLTVYRAKDFAAAKAQVRAVLDYQGKGHSCGIHTGCRRKRCRCDWRSRRAAPRGPRRCLARIRPRRRGAARAGTRR